MPISRSNALGRAGLLTLALASGLLVPRAASATTAADLRVIAEDGTQIAQVRQFTDTTNVPTSPRAKCFFNSKGGSGKPFTVQGPTALGLAVDASDSVPVLQPILVTDEFGFGLGVCGFGGVSSAASNFWQVRINHNAAQVGGDQVILGGGDDVLWALVPAPVCDPNPPFACQPTKPELSLEAPARAKPGQPFAVKVTEYSDAGVPKPAAGVVVTGAAAPTDGAGMTQVTLAARGTLLATRSGAIPSQQLDVCVSAKPKRCPAQRGLPIFGSEREDAIGGTKGPDVIKARGDDDTVRIRGGDVDRVDCGVGLDPVRADRADKVDKRSCEEVIRPKRKGRRGGKGKQK
ncbi:MAG: hypothetical protein ACXWED_02585 [Solirubrobacterales bacterium]